MRLCICVDQISYYYLPTKSPLDHLSSTSSADRNFRLGSLAGF